MRALPAGGDAITGLVGIGLSIEHALPGCAGWGAEVSALAVSRNVMADVVGPGLRVVERLIVRGANRTVMRTAPIGSHVVTVLVATGIRVEQAGCICLGNTRGES
jgi:hypothetical protein